MPALLKLFGCQGEEDEEDDAPAAPSAFEAKPPRKDEGSIGGRIAAGDGDGDGV